MDSRFERLENKIDKSLEHLAKIDITLAKQHVSLEKHMERSDHLEKHVDILKNRVYHIDGAFKVILGLNTAIFLAVIIPHLKRLVGL